MVATPRVTGVGAGTPTVTVAVLVFASYVTVAGNYTTHFIDGHPELVAAAQVWEERRAPFLRVLRDPARAAAIAAATVALGF